MDMVFIGGGKRFLLHCKPGSGRRERRIGDKKALHNAGLILSLLL